MKTHFFLPISIVLCAFICSGFSFNTQAASAIQEIRIGVLAKRGPEKTHIKWDATAEYLSNSLPDYRFRIVPMLFDDIPVLVKNGLVDFVIVNSGIFVELSVKFNVRRILTLVNRLGAHNDTSQFGGVIFTQRSHSGINTLLDLEGKRIAAVHPTSLGGWIMAYKELNKAGLTEWSFSSLDFLNTHDAVVRAVLRNDADVGIVRTDTLERMHLENKISNNQFRIIHPQHFRDFPFHISTPLYPEWPIAKLQHTSPALAKKVALALLQLSDSDIAAIQAKIAGWTIPENYQPVHDVLKYLQLSPYDTPYVITVKKFIKTYWQWFTFFFAVLLISLVLALRVAHLNRELTRRQNKLLQREEQLKATFDQAAVGIAHLSPTGQFLRLNNKLCELSGYSEHELKKLNLKDLISTTDLSKGLQILDEIRRGSAEEFSLQLRFRQPQGRERWVLLSLSCIREINNGIKYLVAIVDDLDLLKNLEHQSTVNQHQKEIILDIAGDGILGLDPAGNHTFINPAASKLLGYEVSEMLGKPSHAMWHHSHADGSRFPEHQCPITAVLSKGVTHRGINETFWRKNGSSFVAEYISTPIVRDDKVEGAVVVFRAAAAADVAE